MNRHIIVLVLIVTLAAGWSQLCGQESFGTAGGDITGTGGSLAITMGQVAWNSVSGVDVSIQEGVQQPWEIFMTTALQFLSVDGVSLYVYPNPVTEKFQLRCDFVAREPLLWKLTATSGKVVKHGKVYELLTEINMAGLGDGAYLFTVSGTQLQKVKTFQIIKNSGL